MVEWATLLLMVIQGGAPLGLPDAAQAALASNAVIKAADLHIDLAESRLSEAKAARLPTVKLSETLTRGNNPVFVFGSLLEQAHFGPDDFSLAALNSPDSITNLRSAIHVNFLAFDGHSNSARRAQAGVQHTQATLRRTQAEQQILFETVRRYFGVLVAASAVDVATEAVTMAESDVTRTRDRLDAGLAVNSDLLASQVQLAEFRQQRIQAEGNLRNASAGLNVTIGSSVDTPHQLTQLLTPRTFDLAPQAELVARALKNRPDVLAVASDIELARLGVSDRRSEYWPEVNLFANLGASTRNIVTGSADYAIGASATFSIFDRGRSARIDQARIEQQLAETEQDRIHDQIRLEVIRAREDHLIAREQLGVAEATLAQASEALRIVQDRYQEGLTTVTDLLRAQTALVRARMNVLESRHNHYVTYAAVLLVTGDLYDVQAFTR